MEIDTLIELAVKHKWIAVASLAIGIIVRMSKSDVVVPFEIPARWRPVAAFALGVASGATEALATGKAWPQAIFGGLISAAFAIGGHAALIRGVANGKEIPIPGLMAKGERLAEALETKRDVAVAVVHAIETEQVVAQIKAEDEEVATAVKTEKEKEKAAKAGLK